MKINLNGRDILFEKTGLFDLCADNCLDSGEATVKILNGFEISTDIPLKDGDRVTLIKKGVFPNGEELESMIAARHTPGVYEKLKKSRVAVAGLGGVGSNVAIHLARLGVGKLHLIDFDIVEPSNLNRQEYFICHLGQKKTSAIKSQIEQINPYIEVMTDSVKIDGVNCLEIFKNDNIVCEAFDNPDAKAMLVNCLLTKRSDVTVIASSGMAGCFDSNLIKTRKITPRLYICGDMKNEAGQFSGLMAPRVAVCAGHISNTVLRIITGEIEND